MVLSRNNKVLWGPLKTDCNFLPKGVHLVHLHPQAQCLSCALLSLVLLLAFLIVVVVMASKRTLILWHGFEGYFIRGFYKVKVFLDRNFCGERKRNQKFK